MATIVYALTKGKLHVNGQKIDTVLGMAGDATVTIDLDPPRPWSITGSVGADLLGDSAPVKNLIDTVRKHEAKAGR